MLKLLKTLFQKKSYHTQYQHELDRYVAAHMPTSVAEVEYWCKQFDRQQKGFGYGR